MMSCAIDVIDRYREAFAVLNHEIRYLEQQPVYHDILKTVLEPYRTARSAPMVRGKARA